MPCSNPLQGYLVDIVTKSGEPGRQFIPVASLRKRFQQGLPMPDDAVGAPCRACMTCKLEKSRVYGLRGTHEKRMYENSCFITLTYSEDSLKDVGQFVGTGYTLVREDIQLFIKRLRKHFEPALLRVFGCGEYGEVCLNCRRSRKGRPPCQCVDYVPDLGRPHFHLCLFNCDFFDRKYFGGRDGFRYYTSESLSKLWTYGHSTVCDLSFETVAYAARYSTKKITGSRAEAHYRGRVPEFLIYPTRGGGLGKTWFDKYGVTDVIPTDSCIARYVKCGVPEYYDRLRARFDPEGLAEAKKIRSERAKLHVDDNTYARLLDKEKCMNAKIKCLVRKLEI